MKPEDDPTLAAFFALLRSGLYERPLAPAEQAAVAALNADDWAALIHGARQQTVTGLLYRAVTHLPQTLSLPGDTVVELMAIAGSIAQESRRKAVVLEELQKAYTAAGLHPVVMKGPSVAAYYEHPELRSSGDLDLYFTREEFSAACTVFPATEKASDGTVHFKCDGVDIDLHDRYFDLHCAARKLPEVGTPEATVLMLSSHILKHAVGAGVGLRQCCDLARAWYVLNPAEIRELFQRTGTLRWNRLLFSFLEEYLGLQNSPFAEERVSPQPLLNIILEGGNFGHWAEARTEALHAGASGERAATRRRKCNTLGRFLHRIPFSLRYAPREALATMLSLARGNL